MIQTFSMAFYHKLDVKSGFTFAIQFFMLTSDGQGGVARFAQLCNNIEFACYTIVNLTKNILPDAFIIVFEMFPEVIVII